MGLRKMPSASKPWGVACAAPWQAGSIPKSDAPAGATLERYMEVDTHHYLRAKQQLPVERDGVAYDRWRALGVAS